MKLTKQRLKEIIKEEIQQLNEKSYDIKKLPSSTQKAVKIIEKDILNLKKQLQKIGDNVGVGRMDMGIYDLYQALDGVQVFSKKVRK